MTSTDDLVRELAEMRGRIARLEAERVSVRDATVTARDTVASTFTAAVDGVGSVAGIKSSVARLPQVGDRVRLSLAGATPVYQPGVEQVRVNTTTSSGELAEVSRVGRTAGGTDASGDRRWGVDENGVLTVQNANIAGEPIIMGAPFTSFLTDAGNGFYAGASRGALIDPAQTPAGGGETGLYEMTVEVYPDTLYLIQTSNIWLRRVTGDATSRIDLNLRFTASDVAGTDPPAVSITSPYFARKAETITSDVGAGVTLSRLFRVPKYLHLRLLLSLFSVGGRGYIEMGSENHTYLGIGIEPEVAQVFFVNLGKKAWTNRAVENAGGGGTTPAPVKTYTYEYYPSWSRWFSGSGSVLGDNGKAYQGYTPHYPANGDQSSQIGDFKRASTGTPIATDLAGATIEKFEVYLHALHWHYNSGGTAVIRYHNNAAAGSLNNYAGDIRIAGWGRGQGRWVDITTWGAFFRDGGAKGIQVGPSGGTDPTFYGYFDGPGSTYPPKIRATYTK